MNKIDKWNAFFEGEGLIQVRASADFSNSRDEDAATELFTYITNDGDIAKNLKEDFLVNLAKRKNRGEYKEDEAADFFMYIVDSATKEYEKKYDITFGIDIRRDVAGQLVKHYESDVDDIVAKIEDKEVKADGDFSDEILNYEPFEDSNPYEGFVEEDFIALIEEQKVIIEELKAEIEGDTEPVGDTEPNDDIEPSGDTEPSDIEPNDDIESVDEVKVEESGDASDTGKYVRVKTSYRRGGEGITRADGSITDTSKIGHSTSYIQGDSKKNEDVGVKLSSYLGDSKGGEAKVSKKLAECKPKVSKKLAECKPKVSKKLANDFLPSDKLGKLTESRDIRSRRRPINRVREDRDSDFLPSDKLGKLTEGRNIRRRPIAVGNLPEDRDRIRARNTRGVVSGKVVRANMSGSVRDTDRDKAVRDSVSRRAASSAVVSRDIKDIIYGEIKKFRDVNKKDLDRRGWSLYDYRSVWNALTELASHGETEGIVQKVRDYLEGLGVKVVDKGSGWKASIGAVSSDRRANRKLPSNSVKVRASRPLPSRDRVAESRPFRRIRIVGGKLVDKVNG